MQSLNPIYLVGAGNLSWHLGPVLRRAGYTVTVVSRSPPADWNLPCIGYDQLGGDAGATLWGGTVVLGVPDDAIPTVSRRLSELLPPDTPVVHTSGATPTDRIDAYFTHRGALWPIRSLRAREPVADWAELPLAYHATPPPLREALRQLAGELSNYAYALDDQQRAQLHLAAVFSNNFVTWLYQIAYELCRERGIPFGALLPIIRNTALAQDDQPPARRQTGAAARGDHATQLRHLALLADHPKYAEVYRRLSALIAAGTGGG